MTRVLISTLLLACLSVNAQDKPKQTVQVKGFNYEHLETRSDDGETYSQIHKTAVITPPFMTFPPDRLGFLLVPLTNGERAWVQSTDLKIHRTELEGIVCPKPLTKGKVDQANHSTRGLGGCKAN